ncbi:cytochrome P460 family protein [Geobacter sp. SVR]|uniref:cytochrome P460 family protein n=1 Tax=Geobacter sp. SVR TaxID=2495594 RepID=UPI00143EF64D|nr:cytochrome P460 family protein [Geobacter sp. SVR]BCS53727.1 cytochrome c [Geobacter sp. SVR]GCF85764.1 cytochrome c [Geobacter sp. SVR]
MKKILISCATTLALLPSLVVAAASPPLPKGYVQWQKSERKVVTEKSSLFYGIHYIYADKKAMQGYRAGNRFPEGSTIVVDFYNIKDGSPEDGAKNMVVLMRKDKRVKETGGWLFAGYGADGKPSGMNPVTTCFGCHKKDAAEKDYVISTIKDFKVK